MLRWSRLLCTLLVVIKYGVVRSLKCPTSASEWDRASRTLQCQPPNYYHCLRNESGANTERCIPKILIQSQKCPVFNQKVSKIDVSGCSEATCPASAYWSNSVFMYPICFEIVSALSPTKPEPTVTTTILHDISTFATTFVSLEYSGDEPSTDTLPLAAIVGITLGVIMICLVGVLIILLVYKIRRNDKAPNMESRKSAQKCLEEQADELSEVEKLLGNERPLESKEFTKDICQANESPLESKESTKDGCQVYVVESQEPKEQKSVKTTESSVRVLVLLLSKPINKMEMNSEAKKMFGPKFYYCWPISHYRKHKQEKSVSLFPQNFDLQNASAKEIFERMRDVVTKTEVDVNFVITLPFTMWSTQRKELSLFINENENLFHTVYC